MENGPQIQTPSKMRYYPIFILFSVSLRIYRLLQIEIVNHPKEDIEALLKPVTKEELFQALRSMNSFKSPGPDGFQPLFFKHYWHVVGDSVYQLVAPAFSTGTFPTELAETLLVLIPREKSSYWSVSTN